MLVAGRTMATQADVLAGRTGTSGVSSGVMVVNGATVKVAGVEAMVDGRCQMRR